MRRSLIIFACFIVLIVAVVALTGPNDRLVPGSESERSRLTSGANPDKSSEPRINVAPVLVRPRTVSSEPTRLNRLWLDAVVSVRWDGEEVAPSGTSRPSARRRTPAVPGRGSGVLAGNPNWVVTVLPEEAKGNFEVVGRSGEVTAAKLIGRDQVTGVSVLDLAEPASVALDWREGTNPQLGDPLFLLGRGDQIGAIRTHVMLDPLSKGEEAVPQLVVDGAGPRDWLGGALLDGEGKVAGLIMELCPESMPNATVALQALETLFIVEEITQKGVVRRWDLGLGLGGKQLLPDGTHGWIVADVKADSPAARAGIVPGEILISIDDSEVLHPGQVRYLAGRRERGEPVSVELAVGAARKMVVLRQL